MELKKPKGQRALISLVPMIDVMLILLVFFMVTSTYLNLDMIPASQRDRGTPAETAGTSDGSGAAPVLIRLGADGVAYIRGQPQDPSTLRAVLAERLTAAPGTPVLVLPSGGATSQALISVMDAATTAGARTLRVVRLEPRP